MNSIATMTEQKHCKDCGTDLVLGHNWTEARQRQGKYLCKSCWTERDKLRMFVNGKEISKSDPLYKPGRWRTWSHVHSMEKLEREGQGYVYSLSCSHCQPHLYHAMGGQALAHRTHHTST